MEMVHYWNKNHCRHTISSYNKIKSATIQIINTIYLNLIWTFEYVNTNISWEYKQS